jgi:uncharacterized repeat protein (TIGR02543 family)
LNITNPKPKAQVLTQDYTVTGTATELLGVAGVYYQVNGQSWTNASSSNEWTNWTAQVVLVPGTNVFAAYAEDPFGNISATNTVKFVYVQTAPITVLTNGNGSVSPDYNGQVLALGQSYTMTAKPAKGFGFAGWTGSVTSTNAKLTFLMASNLTFTAGFTDAAPPTVKITIPTSGQRVTNAMFTATGTATDNVGVTGVFYQLNNSAAVRATSTNEWTNWTAKLQLTVTNANTLSVYAVDAAGNKSRVASTHFNFVP